MSSGNIPPYGSAQSPKSPTLSEIAADAQQKGVPDKQKQDFSNLLKDSKDSSANPPNNEDLLARESVRPEELLSSKKHGTKNDTDSPLGRNMANIHSSERLTNTAIPQQESEHSLIKDEQKQIAKAFAEQDIEKLDARLNNEAQPVVLNTTTQASDANAIKVIQASQAPTDIDAVMNQVAKQIQVSAADAVNGAEVRITLKDNVLAGTEIRIQRYGGELTVMMNTISAESAQLLAQNQAGLQKVLAERFSQEQVQVSTNMMGEDQGSSDGRSRNEYFSLDDDEQSPFNKRGE